MKNPFIKLTKEQKETLEGAAIGFIILDLILLGLIGLIAYFGDLK